MIDPPAIDTPSPNHEPRPGGTVVDMLILHYTGMATAQAARERLCDPGSKVSAHYLIDTDGTIHAMVSEDRRAWHAGVAEWAGVHDINDRSIGIELVNPGHDIDYHPFPDPQIASLIDLGMVIRARHPIPAHRVLGHSDVAPQRKTDPGERLPWDRLVTHGLGIAPAPTALPENTPDIAWFQRTLAGIGYAVPQTDVWDASMANVLSAFQRRFRRESVTGVPERETAARILGVYGKLEALGALA
jgi:N-acetylmuramoyl-L-alanine amidase